MLAKVLVVVAFLAAFAAAQNNSASFIQTFSGGLPFCTQCGTSSQYACSSGLVGAWSNSYLFTDPVPQGYMVSDVSVVLTGSYACSYTPNTIEADINGIPINIHTTTSTNACACNTCDGQVEFASNYAPFGLPSYVYGGKNNVSLTIFSGQICLNNINITISWAPIEYPGTQTVAVRWSVSRYTSPKVCNSYGYDSSSSITLNFVDPLPSNAIVLFANTQIFGSFWCYSSSSTTPTITTTLVSTTIGNLKLASGSNSGLCSYDYQCNGGYWTSGSQMYQTGWPNYKYKGTNTLRLDTTYYPRIGAVALYLTYYIPGFDSAEYKMPINDQ